MLPWGMLALDIYFAHEKRLTLRKNKPYIFSSNLFLHQMSHNQSKSLTLSNVCHFDR